MWIKTGRTCIDNTNSFANIYISSQDADSRCGVIATRNVDGNRLYIRADLKAESAQWLFNKIVDALAQNIKLFDIEVAIRDYDGELYA